MIEIEMLKKIFFYGIFLLWIGNFAQANSNIIDLQNISTISSTVLNQTAQSQRCYYIFSKNDLIIAPTCLFSNEFPTIDYKEAVELLIPHIEWFDKVYEEKKEKFSYIDSQPKISNKILSVEEIKSRYSDNLKAMSKQGMLLRLPKETLAKTQVLQYSTYVVHKDLSNRWNCSKKNYILAMDSLDWLVLKAGESYNYNKTLVNIDGYCKGTGGFEYLFYQGVCGASTQLFRNTLLNPDLEVVQRFNHSQRYVNFYDEYVFGDDAAVYEWTKQFEIKNISTNEVYFKVLTLNGEKYLLSVSAKKPQTMSIVSKQQKDKLTAEVVKKVVSLKNFAEISQDSWFSRYNRKNYDTN